MKTVTVVVFVAAALLSLSAVIGAAVAMDDIDDEVLPPDWEEPDGDRARRLRGE